MTIPASQNVTQMLIAWGQGDEAARDALIPLVYDQFAVSHGTICVANALVTHCKPPSWSMKHI